MKCNSCYSEFDAANLPEVLFHEHNGKDTLPYLGISKKKVITNARDVYPNCGGEFASGVHLYLNGKPIPQRPCSDQFIQGWLQAENDLQDKYILQF